MDFTKTIILLALMTSESIAHEAEAIDSETIRARGIIVKNPLTELSKLLQEKNHLSFCLTCEVSLPDEDNALQKQFVA